MVSIHKYHVSWETEQRKRRRGGGTHWIWIKVDTNLKLTSACETGRAIAAATAINVNFMLLLFLSARGNQIMLLILEKESVSVNNQLWVYIHNIWCNMSYQDEKHCNCNRNPRPPTLGIGSSWRSPSFWLTLKNYWCPILIVIGVDLARYVMVM